MEITPKALGYKVRDKVQGVEGILTTWHDNAFAASQVGISLPAKEGEEAKVPMIFDICTLEIISDEPVVAAIEPIKHDIHLGDEVVDTVTDFAGTVVEFTTFLNGCVYASVTPKIKQEGEYPAGKSLSVARLKVTKSTKTPEKEEKSKVGGPIRRLER